MLAYGGFGISPHTSPAGMQTSWLKDGGNVVFTNIRGDANGFSWEEAGKRHGKLTASQDVIDIGSGLIKQGVVARPESLGLTGRSNGGLVNINGVLRSPGTFGAVALLHPISDMLHYLTDTNAGGWISEYGNPELPEDIEMTMSLSPLQKALKLILPPTLIIGGAGDSRVLPWHAYELAAALQDYQAGPNPVVLMNMKGGHVIQSLENTVTSEAATLAFFDKYLAY